MGALCATALAAAPAVRADPGDPGPAPEATAAAEPADPQGDAAESEPHNPGDVPGQQDDPTPAAEADQGASVGQTADASASAGQQDVDNTAATVRVDEPGDGEPVGQENEASADAGASTGAAVGSTGETTVAQSAQSDATASQTDVSNTSIVVRVGSAGDDGGVSQANVATGSATATTTTPDGVAAATADVTQDGVTNTSVSVRVFSPGQDGPVTQLNLASAAADASPGGSESATAHQDGVQNTTVSIRVGSAGAMAAPSQQNQATTMTSAGAVAVGGDAHNTVLAVAVGGANLDRPGATGLQVWVWTWVWERDEAQDLAALPEPDSWSWSWDGAGAAAPPHGNITSRPADDDDRAHAGSLEWSWDWARDGVAGWSWDWNRQLQLSCASCVWIWNWSWSWAGQPGADDETTPSTGVASSTPAQLNAVGAQASATAAAGVAQTVAQSGAGGATQFAGQLASVSQDVSAAATAQQTGVSSLVLNDPITQWNLVTGAADAGVAGTATQQIGQSLDAAAPARGDQWGGQEIAIAQVAGAVASATQRDVLLLGGGSHVASSTATAGDAAAVHQQLAQDVLAGAGTFSQWAGQLALVEQAADAMSTVVQTGSAASRRTGGAARAAADAADLALVAQQAHQSAWRDGGEGSQSAMQRAYTNQDASASAVTLQQAGTAAFPDARSDADARTRSKILQDASQLAAGSSPVLQDALQDAIVFQRAVASSASHGGIGGLATVVDCALVQQAATQSIGADAVSVAHPDELAFCLPPEPSSSSPPVVLGPPTAAGGESRVVAVGQTSSLGAALPVGGAEPAPASAPQTSARGSEQPRRPAVARHTQSPGGVPAASARARLVPGHTQFSVPPSTQARIDTRPGSHAGAGDAGREPPLPPAGGPSNGVFALAAAASGVGPSGIAAIPEAFALATPALLRSPQGSVVRRPADVLARIDVPV